MFRFTCHQSGFVLIERLVVASTIFMLIVFQLPAQAMLVASALVFRAVMDLRQGRVKPSLLISYGSGFVCRLPGLPRAAS